MTRLQLTVNQLHRDLHWVANSPAILDLNYLTDGYWLTYPLSGKIEVSVDNNDLTKIFDRLDSRKSHLLGIYYEVLWHHLLAEKLRYPLKATNLQIKSAEGTLGEFDLIYQVKSPKQLFHRELAVKYYLGLPCVSHQQHSPWSFWVGPGLKDRLDLKANKLINKQGCLSKTPEGEAVLKQQQLFPLTPEILLQGYLFYPFDNYCPQPHYAKSEHLYGYWLTTCQLKTFIKALNLNAQFTVLAKHEWLSVFCSTIDDLQPRLLTVEALSDYANQHFECSPYPFPLLIASGSSDDQQWQETLRFFLVPDNWLARATSSTNYL